MTEPPREGRNEAAPDALVRVVESLRAIAAWHVNHGDFDGRPFADTVFAEGPPDLKLLAEPLRVLTYGDIARVSATKASPAVATPRPSNENVALRSIMEDFTERELAILLERIVAERPTTLQVLGQRFGVSHQRIAQLERDFRARVAGNVAPGTYFGNMLVGLAKGIGAVMPLHTVLEKWPPLGQVIPGTSIPVWQLVVRVYDGIEYRNGWFAVPSIDDAIRLTITTVEEMLIYPGVAEVGANRDFWEFTDEDLRAWAVECGYVLIQDFAVQPAANVGDALAQALAISSGPQTPSALGHVLPLMGNSRSAATVAASLRDDPRFVRAPEGRWRLRDQPVPYTAVVHAIEQKVRRDGATPLAEVIETGVAAGGRPEAVAVYARYGHLETVDGLVRLRANPQPVAFPPSETPRMYRLDDGWAVLVTITARDIDTGQIQVGSGVGAMLGMECPSHHEIASLPDAAVEWYSPSVTVRLPAEMLRRHRVGDRVLLWFGFGSFEVREAEPLDGEAVGAARALNLFGLASTGDDETNWHRLASALGLPAGSKRADIVAACMTKREFAAAKALAPYQGG